MQEISYNSPFKHQNQSVKQIFGDKCRKIFARFETIILITFCDISSAIVNDNSPIIELYYTYTKFREISFTAEPTQFPSNSVFCSVLKTNFMNNLDNKLFSYSSSVVFNNIYLAVYFRGLSQVSCDNTPPHKQTKHNLERKDLSLFLF